MHFSSTSLLVARKSVLWLGTSRIFHLNNEGEYRRRFHLNDKHESPEQGIKVESTIYPLRGPKIWRSSRTPKPSQQRQERRTQALTTPYLCTYQTHIHTTPSPLPMTDAAAAATQTRTTCTTNGCSCNTTKNNAHDNNGLNNDGGHTRYTCIFYLFILFSDYPQICCCCQQGGGQWQL